MINHSVSQTFNANANNNLWLKTDFQSDRKNATDIKSERRK